MAASGRAYTTVAGKFVSLGNDGPEAKRKFAALLLSLQQGADLARVQSVQPAPKPILSVNELCLRFLAHAEAEYIDRATGKPSAEVDCFKCVTKALRELFGETDAAEFGPLALRALRQKFIAAEKKRGQVHLLTAACMADSLFHMPRTARVVPGGMVFHVLNRGVGRRELFRKAEDYAAFEGILEETLEKQPMRICGYCLMPNHWHLVLWPKHDGDLAAFMQRGGRKRGRRGPCESIGSHWWRPLRENESVLPLVGTLETGRRLVVLRRLTWQSGTVWMCRRMPGP